MDRSSIHGLCQLRKIYVDEKKRHMDDVAGPSKLPEKNNSREKGKEKSLAFKLALDIEHRIVLCKVFEERILDSRVEFSL